jgi:mono/diheme cytochrome c family protein
VRGSHPTCGAEVRKSKPHRCFPSFILLTLVFFTMFDFAGQAQQSRANANPAGKVARGQYIVEGVAMCGMCHTPRTDSGEIDRAHWLDGASLWLLPARPTGAWPLKAPRLAGSPAASDDELVRLLTTGVWKDGSRLRAPMPQFRMSPEDAEAVVAYLRSLTPHSGD